MGCGVMKARFVGFVVFAMGATSAFALDGPGRALVASNTLQIANNPVISSSERGNSVSRAFIPPYSGTVRVKWEVRSGDGTQVSASGNVAHTSACSQQPVTSTSPVAQTCDLRVTGGFPVIIEAAPLDNNNIVYLRNVSLSFTVVDFDGKAIVYDITQLPQ
jgi:hypothetical protein